MRVTVSLEPVGPLVLRLALQSAVDRFGISSSCHTLLFCTPCNADLQCDLTCCVSFIDHFFHAPSWFGSVLLEPFQVLKKSSLLAFTVDDFTDREQTFHFRTLCWSKTSSNDKFNMSENDCGAPEFNRWQHSCYKTVHIA